MKKKLPFLFLILPFIAWAQFDSNPLFIDKNTYLINEKAGIKIGKEYLVQDDVKSLRRMLEYGSKGLPVILYEYEEGADSESSPISQTSFKYNPLGKLAQKTIESTEDDGYKVYYTYDKSGKLIKNESVEIDPPTTIYKYEAGGKILSASTTRKMPSYDKDGEFTGKSFDKPYANYIYKTNENGKIIEEKYFWLDSENPKAPYYTNKFEYNKANQLMKKTNLNGDLVINFTESFFYNDKGLLIKKIDTNAEGTTNVYIYEYCTDCVQSWLK